MTIPKAYHNIRLVAVKSNHHEGFDFFLDFSGQREFLMSYAYNGLIFKEFRDGRTLSELYRWHPKQMSYLAGKKMASSMTYIKRRVEEFIAERQLDNS